jgi:hypothetical protein
MAGQAGGKLRTGRETSYQVEVVKMRTVLAQLNQNMF